MIPSPATDMMTCSMAMEILELFCWMASNEVDEEIAKMENMMSMKTIIQMILSPSSSSVKFQNPSFFLVLALIPLWFLQVLYSRFEFLAPVLVTSEQIEACAARAEQNHVSVCRESCRRFHRLFR